MGAATILAICVAAFLAGIALWLYARLRSSEDRLADSRRIGEAARQNGDAMAAILLDRADGAALWRGSELVASAGTGVSISTLPKPWEAESVAQVLAAADDAPGLAREIDALFKEGRSFERTVRDPDGAPIALRGSVVGSNALLTLGRHDSNHAVNEQATLGGALRDAPIFAWQRDGAGRLVWANTRYIEAVEAPSLSEAIANQGELIAGEAAAMPQALAAQVRERQAPKMERMSTIIDGSRRTLEIFERPHGEGTLGYALDVTAQIAASEALLKQMKTHDDTLSRLHRGVAIFGRELRLNFFNDVAAQHWGLEPRWLQGAPTLRELLAALRDARRVPQSASFRSWSEEFLKDCRSPSTVLERVWHLPDGTTLKLTIQPHPAGGIMLLIDDATGFYALKRNAATASAVYKTALDALNEGVLVVGLDGRCRVANRAIMSLCELEPSQVESVHIRDLAEHFNRFTGDPQIWQRFIGQVSADTEGRRPWNTIVPIVNGTVLGVASAPLPDGATLFAFRDITDSYNKERILTSRNEALEEGSRLKTQFLETIHSASHELKIPLNTVVGFSEILGQEMYGTLNERQHEYVDGIYRASHELRELVSGIIDLAMLEADYFAFRIESVDVPSVIESTASFIRRNNTEAAEFSLSIGDRVGQVPGDAPRFREIIHTLSSVISSEALQGDTIEIGVRHEGERMRFWVGSTGSPLPDAVHEVFRADAIEEAMPKLRRVALSVTLVRQFVERQGGEIWIERGVGKTREAVVYTLLTDADKVRASINRERGALAQHAAE